MHERREEEHQASGIPYLLRGRVNQESGSSRWRRVGQQWEDDDHNVFNLHIGGCGVVAVHDDFGVLGNGSIIYFL